MMTLVTFGDIGVDGTHFGFLVMENPPARVSADNDDRYFAAMTSVLL